MKTNQKTKVVSTPSPRVLYSARSQHSIAEQSRLEEEIRRVRQQIGYAEKRIEKSEKNRLRQMSLVSGGQFVYQRNLNETLSEIDIDTRNIASFREQIRLIESKIAALKLSPAEAAERERVQGLLEQDARERLELDKSADSKLKSLLTILEARAALSLRMRELAKQVDLPANLDLDVDRFESLRRLLPPDLVAASLRWVVWFLGEEPDRKDYRIQRVAVTLPETLRHAHAYRRDEVANLSAREAAEALKDEPLTRPSLGLAGLLNLTRRSLASMLRQ